MYRITYEQGNGYRCGCCRRTYTETHDVETAEQVQNWVNDLYADYKSPRWEDADDRSIISIEKEIGVDIQDQFLPEENVTHELIAKRNAEKEEQERLKKEEQERNLEEAERLEYLRLKEKFKNK
jgi:hypothetical protein